MRLRSWTTAIVLTAALGGCAANELETRRKASHAALAQYPTAKAPVQAAYQLAAIDDAGRGVLEVVNLSDAAAPAGSLWVNARFVSNVPSVPARSLITVKYGDLLESGQAVSDLARSKVAVAKVELEVPGQGLVTVLGPGKR
ncbi:MAG TPA: hypothetical protein VF796_18150 [Humisphaera sp.]